MSPSVSECSVDLEIPRIGLYICNIGIDRFLGSHDQTRTFFALHLLSTISMTISLGICSLQHPICVASRPIRHTIFSGFALKTRTSFRHRNLDPMECPKHNTGIGGAHSAQDGTWAVKLTCISHAQSRHRWHIHSSQSFAVISRGTTSRNTSRCHFS